MSDTDTKLRFFGEDVETLSREQLIRAVYFLNDMLREYQSPQAIRERSLGRVEAMKAGIR